MEKEFVPYEPALELKELGFNEPCIMQWTYAPELIFCTSTWAHPKLKTNKESYSDSGGDCISAPTFSQAFRWFREKYNLHAEPYTANMGAIEYCFQIRDLYSEKYVYDNFVGAGASYSGTFNTPEEAELACLKELIKIVKNG